MKIAISSMGSAMDSTVDARFGRAAMFLIVDSSTSDFEIVENKQNVEAAQGAGIQAAKLVSDAGVGAVITGHCGPKAFQTLMAAGIKVVVGAEGTVEEAVEKYKNGDLKPTDQADVQGHWV